MSNLYAESGSGEDSPVPLEKVLSCMKSCIHVAHTNDVIEQKKNLMDVLLISLSPDLQWTVKLSSFTIIRELCTRLLTLLDNNPEGTFHQESVPSWLQELFQSVSPKVVECIKTIKIAQVHIYASECLLEITKLRRRLGSVHWIDTGFKEELLHQYEVEKNEEAKSFMKKCVDIFENVD